MLANDEELFPGIVGYEDTVIPEIKPGPARRARHADLGGKGAGQKPLDAKPRPFSGP